jgi:hypothetical protein
MGVTNVQVIKDAVFASPIISGDLTMSTDAKKKSDSDNLVLMPDIYAEDASEDEPTVEVIALATPDEDTSEGFDPYDTARLYKK